MKFTKLDLLTLLISLFLFASCENSNTIGLDVDPATEIQGKLIDTITVSSKTLTDDVISTIGLTRYPFGYLQDPTLGTSEASLAMAINVPSTSFRFGKNAVLDSAVLVLPYSTQFYGDTTISRYAVEVHQLAKDISMEENFKSNVDWAYGDLLSQPASGNVNIFRIQPTTTVKTTDIVTGAADTIKTGVAQLRIKLNTAVMQNKIVSIDTFKLNNSAALAGIFKGLHLRINKSLSTGTGGIMFFDMSGTNSRIEFYYKRPNATTSTNIDTVASYFPIAYASNPVAATIKHTYTTAVNAQLNDVSNTQYNVTYLQGLGGLRNKITFPYLDKFYANFGVKAGTKIIVNKAELVIDLSSGTDVTPFTPAPRLALYRYDIAGQRTNLPDNSSTDQRATAFGGYYDAVNKKYVFSVTAYLQDLLDGKLIDYGTYLSTSSSTEFNATPALTSSARSIIGSKANATNKLKLNVYYTVIN
ncbi:DUF4270 domain-containing protein [Pedobacter sp. MC2016-14]|uniref:DUF4270 family protein n=1 Tax=Pedobacter sp. MC2016-14 TaxID=2897327 RepID=UPI001E3D3FD9|nr:DUF4270 family protein [Pedobacter sp. MC2016-14]MCD0487444.1 DUF4270 domain-containing protein [Pedobacter sp. MC2016-14]